MHYFMFSNGEYSDYCVGGMYVCDHDVGEDEWKAFVADLSELKKRAKLHWLDMFVTRTGVTPKHRDGGYFEGYDDWWGSEECEAYRVYVDENNAQELFIKKHNMKPVEYTELWEY